MNRDQEKIADFVCRKFGIAFTQLVTKNRSPFIQRARSTYIYMLKIDGYQTSWIAHILNRPINTINRNVKEIKDELSLPDTNDKLNKLIKETVTEWESRCN